MKVLMEDRETGAPEMVVLRRAMPPEETSSVAEAADSEGGGVGRPVGVAVLSDGAVPGLGVLVFSSEPSKCDPRTLLCTSGAFASAVVIRSTSAKVKVTFL